MKSKFSTNKDGEVEEVTIKFTIDEYDQLMFYLGLGIGSLHEINRSDFHNLTNRIMKFINKMNEGNPDYRPYKVD